MRYLKQGDPCPLCGQPIQTNSYEELELLTLCDKHPDVDANTVRAEVGELAKSTDARYMTAADVRTTLREEYGIDLMPGQSKAIAHELREEAGP